MSACEGGYFEFVFHIFYFPLPLVRAGEFYPDAYEDIL